MRIKGRIYRILLKDRTAKSKIVNQNLKANLKTGNSLRKRFGIIIIDLTLNRRDSRSIIIITNRGINKTDLKVNKEIITVGAHLEKDLLGKTLKVEVNPIVGVILIIKKDFSTGTNLDLSLDSMIIPQIIRGVIVNRNVIILVIRIGIGAKLPMYLTNLKISR